MKASPPSGLFLMQNISTLDAHLILTISFSFVSGVNAALITGFTLPGFILNKARQYMTTMVQYIRDAAANASVPVTPAVPLNGGGGGQVLGAAVGGGALGLPLREVNNGTTPSSFLHES